MGIVKRKKTGPKRRTSIHRVDSAVARATGQKIPYRPKKKVPKKRVPRIPDPILSSGKRIRRKA